ncbi:MAG: hypothetical protein Q4P18_05295 [Methanobrevibacter sp.]|uniref:hypothetical protein n=1 Tax=Methanobrevibacter sp. TaxID=66852 RepID=UPI0026E02546|nr:hypothetical protein [Methanobrevibacter sp.]MDO5848928.1 hypothetical protein [Methanobrevibacter sp.]
MENLKIEGMKDYPIKWICNFRGQKAIGVCGYSQKIAMFAADPRVAGIIEDIVIGTDPEAEGFGCEEKDRCCNFDCKYCEIDAKKYLSITGKKPSNKNVKELEQGLKSLNLELESLKYVPFDKYEVVDCKE